MEINREISFVDATTGRTNETKITEINKLDNSFPEYDINAMSMRSINRSGDKSFDRSFNRSSSRSDSPTGQETSHLTDCSTDPPAEVDHKIHHTILDQISGAVSVVSLAATAANKISAKEIVTAKTHCFL